MDVVALVAGFDVSPNRMGWGLVRLDDGSPVACGMENIDLPSAGWKHQQLAVALGAVERALPDDGEVSICFLEQPWLSPRSGTKSAYSAGRAVQAAQAEVERRWPWAPIEYLQPAEWKSLAGVNTGMTMDDIYPVARPPYPDLKALKPGIYVRACRLGFAPGEHQDAADAGCIAVAGWHRNQDTNERDADWQAVKAARDSA